MLERLGITPQVDRDVKDLAAQTGDELIFGVRLILVVADHALAPRRLV